MKSSKSIVVVVMAILIVASVHSLSSTFNVDAAQTEPTPPPTPKCYIITLDGQVEIPCPKKSKVLPSDRTSDDSISPNNGNALDDSNQKSPIRNDVDISLNGEGLEQPESLNGDNNNNALDRGVLKE
jgi:hypothetical protein